jgi:hypothetical protein
MLHGLGTHKENRNRRFPCKIRGSAGPTGHADFVYLLRWKDRVSQSQAWKKFLADEKWIAIKKASTMQFGDLVDDVQDRSLDMLPYTPAPSRVP